MPVLIRIPSVLKAIAEGATSYGQAILTTKTNTKEQSCGKANLIEENR